MLSRRSTYEPSNELVLPKIIDKGFEMLLSFERWAINSGVVRFPIGGSRLVVARRKDGGVP